MVDNKINGSGCGSCIHCLVCQYRNDFNDVRNAISNATVYKNSDGKASLKKVTQYDIVSGITVNCKHYASINNTVTYRNDLNTMTNPYDISPTYDRA